MNPMDIMAEMVSRENRTLYKVLPYCRKSCKGPKPMRKPEIMAAIRMAVPEAEIQFNWKIAGSGVGFATTGGMRRIKLWSPATGILKMEILSRTALTEGSPHANTSTLKTAHGTHAFTTSPVRCPWVPLAARSASCPSRPQILFGCHTRSSIVTAAIEQTDAVTSTSHGPWKFETKNCGIAKNTPATNTAGQTSSIPLNPAKVQISQNGTSTEKNGSIRPAIPLSCTRFNPLTPARATRGVPKAPK